MERATPPPIPRSVQLAIQLLWLNVALNAVQLLAGAADADVDANLVNGVLLLLTAHVAGRLQARRHWARLAYAFLVALDFALVFALGLDGLSDTDVALTWITLALEAWILLRLHGSEADAWFGAGR